MGLTPRFTEQDIRGVLSRGLMDIEDNILKILEYVGDAFVRDARSAVNIDGAFPKGDYTNQTSNLRSSIGYVVLKDGIIVKNGIRGDEPAGEAAARMAISTIPKSGYQLIGVAGMDYASHVEARRYNVITSQADIAILDIKKLLLKLRDEYRKKGVGLDFSGISETASAVLR